MLEGMVIRMAGDGAGTDETKMMFVRIVLRMQLSETPIQPENTESNKEQREH